MPQSFSDLVWSQALADVRGETSQDTYESRRRALDRGRSESLSARMAEKSFARANERAAVEPGGKGRIDEKAKTSFFEVAFSDILAIYMLSLTLDFNYTDLRERQYPLLAAPALGRTAAPRGRAFSSQSRLRLSDLLSPQVLK